MSAATSAGASRGDGQPEPPVRILLAEDNPANRKLALAMLTRLGHSAEAVSNGLQAVQAAARDAYDVILMDCRMPEMDGFQATSEIRRRQGTRPRTPIIAMTADAMEGDRQRCLEAGMDDYISKPVSLESLEEVLVRWVHAPRSTTPSGVQQPRRESDDAPSLDPSVIEMLRTLGERTGGALPGLVAEFLEDAASNLEQIGDALERGELDTVTERAHALGGTAATFGARRMGGLSRTLQRASAEGDASSARAAKRELDAEFVQVRRELLEEFPQAGEAAT